jgi:hypothetical protein
LDKLVAFVNGKTGLAKRLQPAPVLVVGLPSVPRPDTAAYLLRTLDFILEQTRGGVEGRAHPHNDVAEVPGFPLQLRLVVMNNGRAQPHVVYYAAREKLCCRVGDACVREAVPGLTQHTMYSRANGTSTVTFVDNGAAAGDGRNDAGTPNVPGARVRQQTRDVADLLDAVVAMRAAGRLGPADADWYYMFMEDDFRLCPRALASLSYLLRKAEYANPGWNAIRVSYGLNGALIRGADVQVLSGYYRKHVARRPPDHMTVEWFAGETPESAAMRRGRPHVAFKYNVLEHFGVTSSLRDGRSPVYAFCYDKLDAAVVFDVEMWREAECGHDDIWPCLPRGDARAAGAPVLPQYYVDFPALVANARADSAQTRAMAGNM